MVPGVTALSLRCCHLHSWQGAAGGLWWAAATAGDSPLCPQTTASPSSVPPSLLHVSKVSSIFGARPPQPRENVLGISFKPYSPESGPAPSPCSACESTRKDGVIPLSMGRDGGRQGCHRQPRAGVSWAVRGVGVHGPALPQPTGGQQGLGARRRQPLTLPLPCCQGPPCSELPA